MFFFFLKPTFYTQMSHLTSTLIDDESLIEELRRYGEKNLPTLPSAYGSAASRKKANQLNDTNREIYLKKLNHYKAREKAESNPSKQYLKQQQQQGDTTGNTTATNGRRTSSRFSAAKSPSIKSEYRQNYRGDGDEDEDDNEEDEDNDVIEIDSTQNTSEYVQVSNAYTSPLSQSRHNVENIRPHSNRASLNGYGADSNEDLNGHAYNNGYSRYDSQLTSTQMASPTPGTPKFSKRTHI